MIGIIGGTGLYELDGLNNLELHSIETPYGSPSAPISVGPKFAFLPRHGKNHELLPSEINYRANIWALKSVGVSQIISISSVGSLVEHFRPGELALPDQYLDFTKHRIASFFGDGLLAHINMSDPTCPALTHRILEVSRATNDIRVHPQGTLVCIEGPRYSTRAESFLFKQAGAQMVGMTAISEAFLAREAQICYSNLSIITDYDGWKQDPDKQVSAQKVIEQFKASSAYVLRILKLILSSETNFEKCSCQQALDNAVITPNEQIPPHKKTLLKFLQS
jgi:5'-methylthioadenosine phosphorylase